MKMKIILFLTILSILFCSSSFAQDRKTQSNIPQSEEEEIVRKCAGNKHWSLVKCVELETQRYNKQLNNEASLRSTGALLSDGQYKNPFPSNVRSVARGKIIYSEYCLRCHGVSGKADGPTAAFVGRPVTDISSDHVQEQGDGTLFKKITQDNSPMKAFGDMLSKDDLWNAINYIRTLSVKKKEGK